MIKNILRPKYIFILLLIFSIKLFSTTKNPIIRQEFIFNNPPFKSCHSCSITETINGNLLCAFFAGENEGAKNVSIWLTRHEKGKWTEPKLIASDKEGQPCWNPVFFTFPDGEIILFYKVGPSTQTWSGVIKRSFNNGKTWTSPFILPAGIYGPTKNKPCLIKDKKFLCGSSFESYKRWGCYVEVTKDKGSTWTRSRPVNLPNNYFGMIQPAIIKLSDDDLLMFARTRNSKRIAKSISNNGGKTWSKATLTKLPNPNSGIDAIRLKDERLLMVYNDSEDKRTPLNIALSYNNGKSWKNVLTLEDEEGEFSYPSVIQTKKDLIVVTYTWRRLRIKSVIIDPKNLL